MKPPRLKYCVTFILFVLAKIVIAETATVNGIKWTYTVNKYGTASVGRGLLSSPAVPTTTSGAITIPTKLGGYSVTSIGDYAFDRFGGLTSVTIPNSVTSIGKYAFSDCRGLTSVTIPDSVTSIGDYAFYGCSGLTSVTIPNSVKNIGDDAFGGCSGLTSVTIPNSVKNIGDSVFSGCRGLTSVTIPNSVTSIGKYAFSGCRGLASVTIPDSVTSIGVSAFSSCSGLTSVTMPNSVKNIGDSAFEYCSKIRDVAISQCVSTNRMSSVFPQAYSSITNVVISEGVTSIGNSVFYLCSGLTSVTIPDSVTSISSNAFDGCSASLFDTKTIAGVKLVDGWAVGYTDPLSGNLDLTGVRSIADSAFSGCSSLTSLTMPNSVKSIGSYAFNGCGGLTSVTIPDSVKSIGYRAFSCGGIRDVVVSEYVCTRQMKDIFSAYHAITNVVISDGVERIGYHAFYYCSGLTSVTIPDSVKSIGGFAFGACSGLKSVYITDLAKWCEISFIDNCANPLYWADNLYLDGSLVESLTIPSGVTKIGDYAFYRFGGFTSVTIPDSVKSIGSHAFYECSGRASLTIGSGVTSIGADAFYGSGFTSVTIPGSVMSISYFGGCSSLTSVTIGNGATSIRNSAFYGCSGLTSVTIPNSVTNIGQYAFSGCRGLASVTIPDSVTSIGQYAFSGCSGLTSVTIPNSVTSIGREAFRGCSGLTSMTIPNSVTSIGVSAFYGCSGLASVTIPDSVTTIGVSAFEGCSGLTSMTMPNSVKSIGSYAFNGCSGLTSVTIPDSVKSIGDYAFENCSGLTSVTIPNSVTSIGQHAFDGCVNVTSATVPGWKCYLPFSGVTNLVISEGTTVITNSAFYGCSGLASVTMPDSVESIGGSAFRGCSGLTSVTIPNSVKNIGVSAFSGCSGLTSVTIPNSVKNIGDDAFYSCSGLTSVTIGGSVTNIGSYAFACCSGLTSMTIPNSVTSIGRSAFYNCDKLRDVTVSQYVCTNGMSSVFSSQSITNVVISDSVTSIGQYAFSGCSGLLGLTIGSGVTSIGAYAFKGCNKLTSVAIPDNVTSINNKAFDGCSGLKSIFASIIIEDAIVGGGLTDKVVWTDATTGGDVKWTYDQATVRSGVSSWKCGAISHGKESWLEMDVAYPGLLSFWWRASSESDGGEVYDYAYLSIDGEAKGTLNDYILVGVAIGGKTDWVNVVFDVTGDGPHKIRWTYCKDGVDEADTGEDCVWLDDIVWTPRVPVVYDIVGASGVSPANVAVLAGTTLTLPDASGFSWADHVFNGWDDGKRTYDANETYEVPRTNVTFTAQWIRKSTVAFVLNGGSGTVPAIAKYLPGTVVRLPSSDGLHKAKHTFGGWTDGRRVYDSGTQYTIGEEDVSFVAVWMAKTLSAPVISSADVSNGGTTEAAYATIAMSAEVGTEICYTTDGSEPTAASPRYSAPFVADGTNVVIKAIATRNDYFDSDVAMFTFTRMPYSLPECLGVDGVIVTTGGDSAWGRVLGNDAHDGVAALKSGSLGDNQTNWVQVVVSGPGTISFWWKVSSEGVNRGRRRDGCLFTVDGEESAYSDGTTNSWTQVAVVISTPGAHTMRWSYGKNGNDTSEGEDCAWLDYVLWRPVVAGVDVGEKGTVEASGGGYVVEAKEGETLTEADFTFGAAKEAYVVSIAAGGKSATVVLRAPEVATQDGGSGAAGAGPEEGVGEDTEDSAGVLASVEDIVAKHGESAIKAKPTPKSGETVGALPVKTYEGLYYQAAWGDDLGAMTRGEKIQATGDTLYLGVIKQKGGKGFYKITVSEQ